jgi:REP element-mobilizing transposase RayT
MARGVNRQRIFVDDEDYERYLRLLGWTVVHYGWHLLAYCLMPNHVHLLIETPKANLARGMQWLQGMYAQTFNDRHVRLGPLYQGRYRTPLPLDEAGLVRVTGYIVANPVVAKLCKSPVKWRWGSHARIAADRRPRWLAHARLLDRLEAATGSRCYDQLVATAVRGSY